MDAELVKRAFIGKLLGATGVGPIMNAMKRRSIGKQLTKDTASLDELGKIIPGQLKDVGKLQDEITSRSKSIWTRDLRHLLPGNKKKLQAAEQSHDDLLSLLRANQNQQKNLQLGLDTNRANLAQLLKEQPEEIARMQALYGTGALGAGAYYGTKSLAPDGT